MEENANNPTFQIFEHELHELHEFLTTDLTDRTDIFRFQIFLRMSRAIRLEAGTKLIAHSDYSLNSLDSL